MHSYTAVGKLQSILFCYRLRFKYYRKNFWCNLIPLWASCRAYSFVTDLGLNITEIISIAILYRYGKVAEHTLLLQTQSRKLSTWATLKLFASNENRSLYLYNASQSPVDPKLTLTGHKERFWGDNGTALSLSHPFTVRRHMGTQNSLWQTDCFTDKSKRTDKDSWP